MFVQKSFLSASISSFTVLQTCWVAYSLIQSISISLPSSSDMMALRTCLSLEPLPSYTVSTGKGAQGTWCVTHGTWCTIVAVTCDEVGEVHSGGTKHPKIT